MKGFFIIYWLMLLSGLGFCQKDNKPIFINPSNPGISSGISKSYQNDNSETTKDILASIANRRREPFYKMTSGEWSNPFLPAIKDPFSMLKKMIEELPAHKRTIVDKNFGKTPLNVNLLNRIDELYKSPWVQSAKTELMNILSVIRSLPNSKEKIYLLLRQASFTIYNHSYYADVEKQYQDVKAIANELKDLEQKAIAFIYIGDFCKNFQFNHRAIESLYLAREAAYNSRLSKKEKSDLQGDLCERIAGIFAQRYYTVNLTKADYYHRLAYNYYFQSGNTKKAAIATLTSVGEVLFAREELRKTFPNQLAFDEYLRELALYIQYVLQQSDQSPESDDSVNYILSYNGGTICRIYGYYEAAINYYQESLYYAIKEEDYAKINSNLSNLSYTYSLTGIQSFAEAYTKLLITADNSTPYQHFYEQLQKAETFINLHKNDEAITLLNKLQFDTGFMNQFYPTLQQKLYEDLYKLKSDIFLRKGDDSGYVYKDYWNEIKGDQKDGVAFVLGTESNAVSDWLGRQSEKELSIREELLAIKEENNRILSIRNYLLDSLSRLNENIARQKGDSLEQEKKQRSLENVFYKDSLAKAQKIRELERKNAITEQEKIKATARANYYLLGGAGLVVVGLFFGNRYRNKRNMEKEAIIQKSKIDRINNLVRNNIHNFKNDYATFGNLIYEGDLSKLGEYEQFYADYLRITHENWKEERPVSLYDELQAAKNYFQAKKVRSADLSLLLSPEENELKKILFFQSVFDTLIHNSIHHGFKSKTYPGVVKIEWQWDAAYFYCSITDNGKPPENEQAYLRKEGSGLNLLKARIENRYLEKQQLVPIDFFEIHKLIDNSGTQVKIKIPYEKIPDPDS